MQKKLIVLALAGLVSGGAFAQSSMTMYGIVDLGIQSGKYSNAGNLTSMIDGGSGSFSRIGFKGTEDLGTGLNANFVLESGITPETGTQAGAQFWNRQAYVGLSGTGWGSIALGRNYTPYFFAAAAADPFQVGGSASAYGLFDAGFANIRMNNSIRWDSPNWNGFSVAAMYGLGQNGDAGTPAINATTKNNGQDSDFSLGYANGPITVNYGYDNYKIPTAVAGMSPVAIKRNALDGAYDFKVVTLGMGYFTGKSDDGVTNYRTFTLSGVVPVGADSVLLEYTKLTDKTGAAGMDAKQFGIGYVHPMSKRTELYANYGKINNDANATQTLLDGSNVAAGFSPRAIEMGMMHAF